MMHPIIRVIKEHFNESGMTQVELARRIGSAQSHVSDLLSGSHNPRLDTLVRLAAVFDLQLAVIGVNDKPEPEIQTEYVTPRDFTIRVTHTPGKRSISIEED